MLPEYDRIQRIRLPRTARPTGPHHAGAARHVAQGAGKGLRHFRTLHCTARSRPGQRLDRAAPPRVARDGRASRGPHSIGRSRAGLAGGPRSPAQGNAGTDRASQGFARRSRWRVIACVVLRHRPDRVTRRRQVDARKNPGEADRLEFRRAQQGDRGAERPLRRRDHRDVRPGRLSAHGADRAQSAAGAQGADGARDRRRHRLRAFELRADPVVVLHDLAEGRAGRAYGARAQAGRSAADGRRPLGDGGAAQHPRQPRAALCARRRRGRHGGAVCRCRRGAFDRHRAPGAAERGAFVRAAQRGGLSARLNRESDKGDLRKPHDCGLFGIPTREHSMSLDHWLAFAAASAILLVIPGPTVLLVISYTLGHGRKPAAAIVAGVALGDLTAMTASMLGLGAILLASVSIFTVLRWFGGGYLIYLGIKLWRAPVQTDDVAGEAPSASPLRMFGHSYTVTA